MAGTARKGRYRRSPSSAPARPPCPASDAPQQETGRQSSQGLATIRASFRFTRNALATSAADSVIRSQRRKVFWILPSLKKIICARKNAIISASVRPKTIMPLSRAFGRAGARCEHIRRAPRPVISATGSAIAPPATASPLRPQGLRKGPPWQSRAGRGQ